MSVLSRKEGQRVVIGGNIQITVAAVRGKYVKLCIQAPREVRIQREELADLAVVLTLAPASPDEDIATDVLVPRRPR